MTVLCTGELKAAITCKALSRKFLKTGVAERRLSGKKIRAKCSGLRNDSMYLIYSIFWYHMYKLEYTLGKNW